MAFATHLQWKDLSLKISLEDSFFLKDSKDSSGFYEMRVVQTGKGNQKDKQTNVYNTVEHRLGVFHHLKCVKGNSDTLLFQSLHFYVKIYS